MATTPARSDVAGTHVFGPVAVGRIHGEPHRRRPRAQPDRNVLLIVGGFHVERDGGTTRKLRIFRPHDRILVVRYRTDEEGADFMPADEKSGEFLIIGQAGPQ